MKNYDGYKEEVSSESTGKVYTLYFSVQGKYITDATIMIMEMPATTEYACGLTVMAKLLGAVKKETEIVEKRADGIPENYPESILPLFKMKELFEADGESDYSYVRYYSSGTYQEAIAFFRSKLNDKSKFEETSETKGETRLTCLVPGWEIEVTIMDENGSLYIDAQCYVN